MWGFFYAYNLLKINTLKINFIFYKNLLFLIGYKYLYLHNNKNKNYEIRGSKNVGTFKINFRKRQRRNRQNV